MRFEVESGNGSYAVTVNAGEIKKVGEDFKIDGKTLVVTDTGVPREYLDTVLNSLDNAFYVVIPEGEENKNIDVWKSILSALVENGFTRTDSIIALGGGVVGDMAGFAAASYMRGINFYNIPTTVLSQMDSSIGGKTAIDFMGYKNIVGAFYQPKGVIVDPLLIRTQDKRQIVSGLAESVKMAATFDEELFKMFENGDPFENYQTIVERSLLIKKSVVEKDEKEGGLRRVLNFGHTIGHAIERCAGLGTFYHGECVALGMMYTSYGEARERIRRVSEKLALPTEYEADKAELSKAVKLDKKAAGTHINIVTTGKIGSFEMKNIGFDDIEKLIEGQADKL